MEQNNVFTVAKRKVDGQDMVYQSLKFSNGLWALAELKIKPGSSTIGVSVCPLPNLAPWPENVSFSHPAFHGLSSRWILFDANTIKPKTKPG